mgnify:CR=1 FL=1
MIVYSLICPADHEFEGWFKDSAAFDEQAAAGSLSCPICGKTDVRKAIMAPAVKETVTKAKGAREPSPEEKRQVHQFIAGYRKFIEDNAENVGRNFPEEARKIHYGETEERAIYGESTLPEVKELIEEGIDVAPMPPDPGDLN